MTFGAQALSPLLTPIGSRTMSNTIRTTTRAAVVTATAALTFGVLSLQPTFAQEEPSPSVSPTTAVAPAAEQAPSPGPTPAETTTPAAESTPAAEPTTPAAPSPSATPTDTASPSPSPTPTPTPTKEPYVELKKGVKHKQVRELQSRLHQLGLHNDAITSTFGAKTQAGVVAFQEKHKIKGRRGVVGKKTWAKLLKLTRMPTADELNNVYKPGKPILRMGTKSKKVREVEARLKQLKLFKGKVGATYDKKTRKAVRKLQKKVKIPITGEVDARTLERLRSRTRKPNRPEMYNLKSVKMDKRCRTGRVLCIDKTSRSLRWVVEGVVKTTLDARFGSASTPTREGQFKVFTKSRNHVSSIYGSSMPFAMFFSGGQAVHYSPDFARVGYNGASHGCVNIRDRKAIAKLFDKVRIGDKVVVYRS